jgi:hypothetical protein
LFFLFRTISATSFIQSNIKATALRSLVVLKNQKNLSLYS